MGNMKIDIIKLNKMLRSGKSVKQCASFFGVSPSAVSQAKKGLNINVVKSVAMESAHRIVDQNLNTVEQLQKINVYANDLLDLLMRLNSGDKEALQALESKVLTEKGFKFKDPRELALKAMAEIRGQLKLQLEVFQTLYDMRAVGEFQEEVLAGIGEVAPDVRNRIVGNLQRKRALYSAVKVN